MQDDMMDRFMRSCQLVKASWDVLRSDRELVLFPILSILATASVLLMWGMLIWGTGIDVPETQSHDFLQLARTNPVAFGWVVAAGFLIYFIAIFFNAALVGAALERLEGGNPTVGSALSLSFRRIGPIFGYALVSVTVGFLMAMIVERIGGVLGRLLGIGFGFAWTVATFLVVPILAAEGVGPIRAIEESSTLLRKTWGENLIGNVGISLAMSALTAAIMVFGILSGIAASRQGYPELVPVIFACTAFLFVASALVGSALRGVYVAAVYYYATVGEPPWGFGQDALQGAFTRKAS